MLNSLDDEQIKQATANDIGWIDDFKTVDHPAHLNSAYVANSVSHC